MCRAQERVEQAIEAYQAALGLNSANAQAAQGLETLCALRCGGTTRAGNAAAQHAAGGDAVWAAMQDGNGELLAENASWQLAAPVGDADAMQAG